MPLCRLSLLALGSVFAVACSTETNYLGFNKPEPIVAVPTVTSTNSADAGDVPLPAVTSTVQPMTLPLDEPDASVGSSQLLDASAQLDAALSLDSSLLDASDASEPEPDSGAGLALRNHFVEVVGASAEEVSARIEDAFQQLFHGDPSSQSIYVTEGEDEAYILDVLHTDTRMDAIGYGLLISVELDHREEFDKIFAYAKNHLQFTSGAHAGYFAEECELDGTACPLKESVLGTQFAVTALWFAKGRWGKSEPTFDYGAEAEAILDTFLHIEERNGGVTDEVTTAFNPTTALPQEAPTLDHRDKVAPGSVWPAFFEIWAKRTKDEQGTAFWATAAQRSREYLNLAAHPTTGLYAHTTTADGVAVAEQDTFEKDSYGVWLSLALDQTWYAKDASQVELANRVITFFSKYGGSYPSDLKCQGCAAGEVCCRVADNTGQSGALVAMNGTLAGIATIPEREAFIRTVWDTRTPVGGYRYFDGVNYLLSMMYLAGELRPY